MDVLLHCDMRVEGSYFCNVDAFKRCVLNEVVPFASRDSYMNLPRIGCDEELTPESMEGEIDLLYSGRIWFNVWTVDIFDAVRALDKIVNFAVHFGFRIDYRITSTVLA